VQEVARPLLTADEVRQTGARGACPSAFSLTYSTDRVAGGLLRPPLPSLRLVPGPALSKTSRADARLTAAARRPSSH
jgi:hypothetical protein